MTSYAKAMHVGLPDWLTSVSKESDENAGQPSKDGGEEINEDPPPIDEMVGQFVHKDFGGTVFGGTIVATDTCKDSKKKNVRIHFGPTTVLTLTLLSL